MLRELHEATAAATALKADNAEKLKQLRLKEDALKAARSDMAKVTPAMSAKDLWKSKWSSLSAYQLSDLNSSQPRLRYVNTVSCE